LKGLALKNLHLILSIVLIIPIALAYGLYPVLFLPKLFGFRIDTVNLASIFKAIMGLYLGMSALWITGIIKPRFWVTATVTNVAFMGGLAFGRLISLVTDGIPGIYFIVGFVVEFSLAFLALRNLRKFGSPQEY
jgi:Domain of unknown function (DUF4345)